jgi:hypothetical protein
LYKLLLDKAAVKTELGEEEAARFISFLLGHTVIKLHLPLSEPHPDSSQVKIYSEPQGTDIGPYYKVPSRFFNTIMKLVIANDFKETDVAGEDNNGRFIFAKYLASYSSVDYLNAGNVGQVSITNLQNIFTQIKSDLEITS